MYMSILTSEEYQAINDFRRMTDEGKKIIRQTLKSTKKNFIPYQKIVDIKDLKK